MILYMDFTARYFRLFDIENNRATAGTYNVKRLLSKYLHHWDHEYSIEQWIKQDQAETEKRKHNHFIITVEIPDQEAINTLSDTHPELFI